MATSELITPHHQQRKAVIYIRQSSPHQVLSNQESLRLQYDLKQRALHLGWSESQVDIIDADLGLSGQAIPYREGFKDLIGRVTLGEVGIILSYEVTRLSRNCTDWYPLLDLCSYKGCLIADHEGVYDPATPNGRLLLGLKGQLSELELHTLRSRLTAGLLNKAQRGELALTLPVGLVRDAQEKVDKDPNREIQHRLTLVFDTFLQRKSASKVLRFFNEHSLGIPRRDRFGTLIWKKPTVAAILTILKNPAYAGAFAYGKTRSIRTDPAQPKTVQQRVPMAQWKILVKDKYPAYISWETFETIQTMLQDNYAEYDRNKSRGIPREGATLLQGIVYCGACGHKMMVQYKSSSRYICNFLRQQHGTPVCQYLPADPIDAHVVDAFFEALSPIELDAYAQVMDHYQQQTQQLEKAHQQQLQRLRYQVGLTQRQFDQVDPDNRLVAAELEQRWESALQALKNAEAAPAQPPSETIWPSIPPDLQEALVAIGQKLPQLWKTSILSTATKKALLRCLIDKVVMHRSARDQVHTRIVWKGGATTTLEIPIPVGAFADLSFAQEMENQILTLTQQGHSDDEIAQRLTEKGYRSPLRAQVLPSTVRGIRLKHRLFRTRHQSHPRRIPGYLTVPQLAQRLDVPRHWIYHQLNKGTIPLTKEPKTGLYLFPDVPTTLEQMNQLKEGQIDQVQFTSIGTK